MSSVAQKINSIKDHSITYWTICGKFIGAPGECTIVRRVFHIITALVVYLAAATDPSSQLLTSIDQMVASMIYKPPWDCELPIRIMIEDFSEMVSLAVPDIPEIRAAFEESLDLSTIPDEIKKLCAVVATMQ